MYQKQIAQKASPSLRSMPKSQDILPSQSYGSLSAVVQRVQQDPNSVSEDERQQLESAIGTRSTREILAGKQTPWVPEFHGISAQLGAPIQAKLIVGEVGDKYEQEADRVAKDVVQQIHAPQANAPTTLQRQETEEELQRKPLPEIVQRREAIGGGEVSTDLDTAINSARGSGQPLDAGLQQSMGQAMGADFSGVRVHTDTQSDQLNQSIQAKAFTTGQDVFFRQGEYQPGSRGGQELIAHELTHVVQQNASAVQSGGRSTIMSSLMQRQTSNALSIIQRALPSADEYKDLDISVSISVNEYNILGKPKEAIEYQNAFVAMQKVERLVYKWFDDYTQKNQKFGNNADVGKMNDLLAKLREEHKTMIESSKDLTTVLPFDTTGLENKELIAMQTLWQDIVNNRGKIKLIGGDDFNKTALSQLGTILSTPTGRQMLSFLNSPPPSGYKQGEKPELTNIYIGEKIEQLPQEVKDVSPDLQNNNRAEAQPINIDSKNGRTVENMLGVKSSQPWFKPKATDYPAVNAENLSVIRDALMGGKKGFTYNRKKYQFNENRTGAFVTNVEHSSLHPAKKTGNQIQSPMWVTLAHELGHAANMRAGATTLKTNELSSLGGKNEEAEKWDNPEELLNIENIENAIRKESGLTERFGHRPPDWLLDIAPKVRSALRKPLDELYKIDQVNHNFDNKEFKQIYNKVNTLKAQIAIDPEGLDDVKKELKQYIDDKTNDSTDQKIHTKAIEFYNQGVENINKLLLG